MKTRVLLMLMFIALLALPMVANAQEVEVEPEVEVVDNHVTAVNNGDAVAAAEPLAEDAAVTVPEVTTTDTESEDEGDDDESAPVPTTTYSGEEIEGWIEAQAKANANINIDAEACTVAGDVVTCNAVYKSDALAAQGLASLSGTLEAVVVEGKIQSWDFIPSAESAAQIQAAKAAQAPQTLPVSGGTPQATTTMMLVALGLLLMLAGAATYAFQRRGV